MNIEFKVIAPKKGVIEKQIWDSLKKQLLERLQSKLKNVECPDHHEHPRVTVTGSIENPQIEIGGCCKKLVDIATEALK